MTTCNLLPWNIQRQQVLALRLRQWLVAAAAALMLTAIWFSLAWERRAAEQRDADELNRQSRFVTYLSNQVESLRKQNRTLAYREALLARLEEHLYPLSVLGIVGESAKSCGGIVVDRIESKEQAHPPETNTPENTGASATVRLRVEAASSLPVAQFVLALRERQVFRKVELKDAADSPFGAQASNWYTIECTY